MPNEKTIGVRKNNEKGEMQVSNRRFVIFIDAAAAAAVAEASGRSRASRSTPDLQFTRRVFSA